MIPSVPTFTFGGIAFAATSKAHTVGVLLDAAERREGGYVGCSNTHSVVESTTDATLNRILNGALLNIPDGTPIAWVGRIKGHPAQRITGPDVFEALLTDPRGRRLRHYFYGGSPESMARILERAGRELGPGAVAGSHCPPFRKAGEAEDPAVIAAIAAAEPHFIWVGLGMPKQEYWMARYASAFPGSILIGVGAAFDWYAGLKPRAPEIVQKTGFEWLFRLLAEPRRLWRRYAYVVPRALLIMIKEMR